ncbi:MAG TPA: branched-chain amino acid ABC transporter permease [Geminicoccaceae bacterium]|jgi:branched-chain amino acid transport system permease protein|nr:branched-chain amino acid ABC transporter permease [Geminicoccaceae bacterium]
MELSLLADPTIVSELIFQGLVRGAMYALMGIGLSLIFGILGVVNFAHGEFFMLGTYAMYYVSAVLGLPFLAGVAAAAMVLFVVGVLIERGLIEPLRKRAGRDWLLDSFVLTIGLMVILQNLALLGFGSRRRGVTTMIDGSLSFGDVVITYERLAILGLAIVIVVLLAAYIKLTDTGKAIRATAQHPEAAQTLGIDINRIYTVAFGIGAALAGAAGALLISIFPAFPTVGYQPVLKSFAVVILGGLGNIPGAIAGGFLLGIVEAYAIFFMSAGWQSVITPLIIIAVLILRPQGLFTAQGERP